MTVTAAPEDCSFQFNPVGTAQFNDSCDIVKATLPKSSVNTETVDAPAATAASVQVGETVVQSHDANVLTGDAMAAEKARLTADINAALTAAGYPLRAADNTTSAKDYHFLDIFDAQNLKIVPILTYLIVLVTMVYGPIAAQLVELYPHPLLWPVAAVSHRQRLVRLAAARDRFRDLSPDRQHLCGPVACHRGRGHDGDRGPLFVPNNSHKNDIFTDDKA